MSRYRKYILVGLSAIAVCIILFAGGRAIVRLVAEEQRARAEQRAQREAREAQARAEAIKEKRRVAASKVPLVTLGSPKSTHTPPLSTPGSAVGKRTPSPRLHAEAIKPVTPQSGLSVATLPGTSSASRIEPGRVTPPAAIKPAQTELLQSGGSVASAPSAGVIRSANLSGLERELPPALEDQRAKADADANVIITSGFECSAPLAVTRKSATHYTVKFEGKRGSLDNYFLFRVQGVKGKTVRIDFEDAPLGKWWSLNPVYSYVTDLSDPENFRSEPVANPKPPVKAHNGPLLPDTSGEKWHFMPNVWTEQDGWKGAADEMKTRAGRLCMVHTFEEDSAYVALKVPYTPSMNERFMESLKKQSERSSHRNRQDAGGPSNAHRQDRGRCRGGRNKALCACVCS